MVVESSLNQHATTPDASTAKRPSISRIHPGIVSLMERQMQLSRTLAEQEETGDQLVQTIQSLYETAQYYEQELAKAQQQRQQDTIQSGQIIQQLTQHCRNQEHQIHAQHAEIALLQQQLTQERAKATKSSLGQRRVSDMTRSLEELQHKQQQTSLHHHHSSSSLQTPPPQQQTTSASKQSSTASLKHRKAAREARLREIMGRIRGNTTTPSNSNQEEQPPAEGDLPRSQSTSSTIATTTDHAHLLTIQPSASQDSSIESVSSSITPHSVSGLNDDENTKKHTASSSSSPKSVIWTG